MPETAELRQKIRQVLEEVVPAGPEIVERALDRIMEAVDPFEQAEREELERFRETSPNWPNDGTAVAHGRGGPAVVRAAD